MVIRRALPEDVPHLPDLERAAGAAFADIGMTAVAQDEPPSVEVLAGYQRAGRAWVATARLDRGQIDDEEVPVAYLLLNVVDGAAHVEQVSVHPSHAGQRLGSALLDAAAAWAAENRLESLTLTTFAEVPWNAPYYARLGFRVVPADELGEGLRRLREHEAAAGLDRWPRVVMRRRVVGT